MKLASIATRAPLVILGLALAVSAGFSQEYRATVLGVVMDAGGAAVPRAKVTILNNDTQVPVSTEANDEGNYVIPYLVPGNYHLRVEQAGFKTFDRTPIEVRVNDRLRVDVQLVVGDISEHVTVTAEAPLLEQSSSDLGQVIENRAVTDLPMKSKNPYTLMALSTGVQYNGSLIYFRPFDNGAIGDFSINGGRNNSNEYQIDGAPNDFVGSAGSSLAYVPPVEATQEFKVQTNSYDAQYGRTGGGVISVSIKPGTNSLHGAAYEQLRRTDLVSNLFVSNATSQPRQLQLMDQYGFEIDGPVRIPKVYNGKDRTFFMFSAERYRDASTQPPLGSIPTDLQRKGDFSQTFNASGKVYTIYDPSTVRANPVFDPTKSVSLTNLQFIRTPFAGNVIPGGLISPIAAHILQDIPMPNQPGNTLTHANNWYGANALEENHFKNFITRVDHTFSESWRIYGRANYNNRINHRDSNNDWNTPASGAKTASWRNYGAVIDAVQTINPHTILDLRLGFNRRNTIFFYSHFDQTQLGFPASMVKQLQMPDRYPVVSFANYMGTNNSESSLNSPSDTYSGQASVLEIVGKHSMKFGTELRQMRWGAYNVGGGAGSYSFSRNWTSSNPQVNDPNTGDDIASFVLGYMATGSATLNLIPYYTWHYPVFYFQDDWQVSRRLTLNLGLRWDFESPIIERFNRQNRGFDQAAASPLQIPGYTFKGGLQFAGVNGQPRTGFDAQHNNWQPRAGLAYRVLQNKPLVFRGGLGRYYLPATDQGGTAGFSQVTSSQVMTADYFPFQTLANPFPNGLIQIPGSSKGLATGLGDPIAFGNPTRKVPYVWQYSAGFQYELKPGVLVDASYVGSQTSDIQVSRSLNFLSSEQLALGTPYLSQVVANPFYGVLAPTTTLGAQATIQRRSLLVPYPQFSSVTRNNNSLGSSWYHSAQLKVQKRLSQGIFFLVSYTASKTMESVDFLNPQNIRPTHSLASFDVPQRLAISGIFEVPFGQHRKFLHSGLLSKIVSGWDLNWTGVVQSGTPMAYPAGYYVVGDPRLAGGQTLDHWFDTSKSIWVSQPADTLRIVPTRSPNIRRHTAPQFDGQVIRDFIVHEGHTLQFKLTALNLTNTPLFDFPNNSPSSAVFGVVPKNQVNLPRYVELGFRYRF